MFWNLLAQEWFPQVPGLVERLTKDSPARVVDVGCGTGRSTIAIARGFPDAAVVGLDLDEASVVEARANAEQQDVHDRVAFEVRDAADPGLEGRFDLVCAFETVHDMADQVGALRAMRGLAAADGFVLVMDERVADTFTTDSRATRLIASSAGFGDAEEPRKGAQRCTTSCSVRRRVHAVAVAVAAATARTTTPAVIERSTRPRPAPMAKAATAQMCVPVLIGARSASVATARKTR
ncbi:MAG TPA: class I SAM-dependent methyltransferase [Egibacteraceae bacterium]|jgi:predicted O-methyltransferase YrrM|nr:class I SAM-dependent methyltransferase [Egibacteraceae bacterium]